MIRKLMRSIREQKRNSILAMVTISGEVVFEVIIPMLMANLIDYGIDAGNMNYIVKMGLVLLLSAAGQLLCGIASGKFAAEASSGFARNLRHDMFYKVQNFSFSNIDKFSTASIVTRLTTDVTNLQNTYQMIIRMAVRSPLMMIFSLVAAFAIDAQLSLIFLAIIPILALGLYFIMTRTHPIFERVFRTYDWLNGIVQENLHGIRVVKSFVREDFEKERFAQANGDLKSTTMRALSVVIMMMPAMMLVMNFTILAVIWFGGQQVIGGTMAVGDLTAFINYVTQILMSLMMLTMVFMNSSRTVASARRISEVLDEKIDLTDERAAHRELSVARGEVEFKNVSFRYYKTSDEKVLDNINLTIRPGETVGIIGSTGCGKTTLVSMIPRLYDVDEGEVLVDGVDVRDYDLVKLRDGVGMVLQKNVLFSGTIEENLRWGDADAPMEAIAEAAKSAQADDFIRKFPEGYQTVLDQGGTNVSGGQKQRLCIARALLKRPKILILDDSTSAVDTATEMRIRAAFRNELRDSTKIVIAQRVTSVMDADKIVVMDEGRITGVGTHAELLASNREYQEIYYSQMDRKEEA